MDKIKVEKIGTFLGKPQFRASFKNFEIEADSEEKAKNMLKSMLKNM